MVMPPQNRPVTDTSSGSDSSTKAPSEVVSTPEAPTAELTAIRQRADGTLGALQPR